MSTTAPPPRWIEPPDDLHLGPDDVHVWRVALDVPPSTVARLRPLLDEDERARVDKVFGNDRKRRLAVSHGVLRTVLGRYLDTTPAELAFRRTANGKPSLTRATDLQFNLSHSDELALIGLTRGRPLGVDVERIRPMARSLDLAERYFTEAEVHSLRALPDEAQESAFFRAWTMKEAYVKAQGRGVFGNLGRFEVALGTNDRGARLVTVDEDPGAAERWTLEELHPREGYAGAFAIEARGLAVTRYRWP